jgi:hypothetical protein
VAAAETEIHDSEQNNLINGEKDNLNNSTVNNT